MTAWNALECALIWLVAALAVGMLIGGVIEYRDRQLPGEDEEVDR